MESRQIGFCRESQRDSIMQPRVGPKTFGATLGNVPKYFSTPSGLNQFDKTLSGYCRMGGLPGVAPIVSGQHRAEWLQSIQDCSWYVLGECSNMSAHYARWQDSVRQGECYVAREQIRIGLVDYWMNGFPGKSWIRNPNPECFRGGAAGKYTLADRIEMIKRS